MATQAQILANLLFSWLQKRPVNRPVNAGRDGADARIFKTARPRTQSQQKTRVNPCLIKAVLIWAICGCFYTLSPAPMEKSTMNTGQPANLFMRNKPNLCVFWAASGDCEEKQTQFKANLLNARINIGSVMTKHYEDKGLRGREKNKAKTKPISPPKINNHLSIIINHSKGLPQTQSNPIPPRKTGKIPCSTVHLSTVQLSQAKGLLHMIDQKPQYQMKK